MCNRRARYKVKARIWLFFRKIARTYRQRSGCLVVKKNLDGQLQILFIQSLKVKPNSPLVYKMPGDYIKENSLLTIYSWSSRKRRNYRICRRSWNRNPFASYHILMQYPWTRKKNVEPRGKQQSILEFTETIRIWAIAFSTYWMTDSQFCRNTSKK